jgi:hypothetical protein
LEEISIVFGGILVGILSGFFGVGGGTITVPMMLYYGLGIKYAVAISSMQMVFGSFFGTILNHKKNLIQLKDVYFLGIGGIFGGFVGGYSVSIFDARVIEYIFISIILFNIIKLFLSNPLPKGEENKNIYLHLIIGFCIGCFSGLIGVGGAILLTPILVSFLNFELKKSIAISLFFVFFTSISSFMTLFLAGFVDIKIGLLFSILSLIGIWIGINLSQKIESKKQKLSLVILNIIILISTLIHIF